MVMRQTPIILHRDEQKHVSLFSVQVVDVCDCLYGMKLLNGNTKCNPFKKHFLLPFLVPAALAEGTDGTVH